MLDMSKKKKKQTVAMKESFFGVESKGVRLVPIDWNKECKLDMVSGKGFRVTEPAIKSQVKLYNGIQSERFGTDFDSDDGFKERYRCPKGCTTGKVYKGTKCPVCGGTVEFKDTDLSITGWIILDNYRIIHPIFYNKLSGIIGDKVFPEIVVYDKQMKRDGSLEQKSSSSTPFYGIGVMGLYERFDEVIEYYASKKKTKKEEIAEIIENKDIIFPNCIPVYSAILRPMSFKGESLFYGTIDKSYNKIFAGVRLLNDIELYDARVKKLAKKDRERMDRGHILTKIQLELMILWKLIFDQVDGKYGQIQGEILGGMLNWSSRDVIIPNPDLEADQITLNYYAFLELFKFEIIAHIVAINDVSESEAINQWEFARIEFNPKIYEIMNHMIKKDKKYIIINRNPTINYGSLLCVYIAHVTDGLSDNYTMGMPEQILTVMNADQPIKVGGYGNISEVLCERLTSGVGLIILLTVEVR